MDSLIQRWKQTVGSGQKSGSFSSRSPCPINQNEITIYHNLNASTHSASTKNEHNRSLSSKRKEISNHSPQYSSSSSSSDTPHKQKQHQHSQDKLDDIFSSSCNKNTISSNQNSNINKQISQGVIKPPLKQNPHSQIILSPQRNTSTEEQIKFKQLKDQSTSTKTIISSQQQKTLQNILNSSTNSNADNVINNQRNNNKTQQISLKSQYGSKSNKSNNEKTLTFYLDESVFRIMDVFKSNEQTTFQERVIKIRNVLNNLVDNYKSYYETNSYNSYSQQDIYQSLQIKETEKTLAKIKQTSLAQKSDQNSKIINDLENKLFECERTRIQLKTENDQQQIRIQSLQKEIQQIKITNQMIDMVRESQLLLERNNTTLHEQLKKEEQKNLEQQNIFQSQLQEVQQIIIHLKQQLSTTYQNQSNQIF